MERIEKAREIAFMKSLRSLAHRDYIEQYFLYCAAPVIAGAKPAALMSFRHCCRAAWQQHKRALERTTGLRAKVLYESRDAFSVLVYNARLLDARVHAPASRHILARYGYPLDGNLRHLLTHLGSRFCGDRFPHEIGVFLGYPPQDVQAFIENNGKDYLCCRYWKVYHDEEGAARAFQVIDEAREQAIALLARKTPIRMAARTLAAMQMA